MVQLKAASLGASTSNTNQAVAEGLAGLTQGLVQGMKLKFLKDQQAREQADWERQNQERLAAQRGLGLLAGETNYRVPDHTAQVGEAMPQIQAGADAVRDATKGTPVEFMGDMISRGAMSSSKPLGQAFDWENLKKHQSDFMASVQQQVAQMDPREGALILSAAKKGLVEDAKLLARTHAVSQAHDDMVSGAFDVFTPDGQKLRDPEVMRAVSDLAMKVENGTISPEQYEATVGPLRQQAHASWVENKQRFYLAQSAQKDLDAMANQGVSLPDSAVSAHHELEVGRYDPKQFKQDWPELLKGKVKYKGEWEYPETITKLQKLEVDMRAEQAAALQALTEERRQQAYAKSPMGQARAFMYQRALEQAKGEQEKAGQWRESFDKAMAQPGRSVGEAAQIANVATGLNVPPPAGDVTGVGAPKGTDGAPAKLDYKGAAEQMKGKSRAEVISALAGLRASGQITDEDGKQIIAAMGGLPPAPGIKLDPNWKPPIGIGDLPAKVDTSGIEADRQRLIEADKLPQADAFKIRDEIRKKYGLTDWGELDAFKNGTLRGAGRGSVVK